MSSTEDILEDYYSDIEKKTNIVRQRQGVEAFLPRNMVKGVDGYSIFEHPDTYAIACADRGKKCRSKKGRQNPR